MLNPEIYSHQEQALLEYIEPICYHNTYDINDDTLATNEGLTVKELTATNEQKVQFIYSPANKKVSVYVSNGDSGFVEVKNENIPKELRYFNDSIIFKAFCIDTYAKVVKLNDGNYKLYIEHKGLGGMFKGSREILEAAELDIKKEDNIEFKSIIPEAIDKIITLESICIYNDDGVGTTALKYVVDTLVNVTTGYKINFIDAKDILAKEWIENAVLLVMPGGADIPYTKKLNGEGNKIIKQYVESGGSYLGFCAGAYYGSNFIEFDKNGELEVLGERELAFFPDKSIGPILAKYDYKTNSGARAALLKLDMPNEDDFTNIKVYYNGGGYFHNANSYTNVNVLAYYHIEKDDNYLPAIVEMKYNKGTVILSGVHFECLRWYPLSRQIF